MNVESSMGKDLPRHIAIVMDGNGRWATRRGLPRPYGHEQGAKVAEDIVTYANELGISYVTLYAFSTENWQRPTHEVDAVMHILERYLRNDVDELIKNDVKMNAIGDLSRLPQNLQAAITDVMKATKACKKIVITLALSYGAWDEISRACNAIIKSGKKSVDEKTIRAHLYTSDLPDPDLLIRCGGEYRLSNFLMLQASYSELYFCPTLWPDFKRADLDLALSSFSERHRRYGASAQE